jgi:hypothetical protein
MNLVQSLKQGALSDESKLHKILDRREASMEQKAKLNQAEDVWSDAIEDGVIDADEQSAIRDAMNQAGLGKTARGIGGEGPISGHDLEKLSTKMDKQFSRARRSIGEHEDADRLDTNLLLNEIHFQYKAAADVLKMKHNTYKSVIDNLKA